MAVIRPVGNGSSRPLPLGGGFFIRKSGLIPRGLLRLKQIQAYKNLEVNQTVL
jgi:hypothetical protein